MLFAIASYPIERGGECPPDAGAAGAAPGWSPGMGARVPARARQSLLTSAGPLLSGPVDARERRVLRDPPDLPVPVPGRGPEPPSPSGGTVAFAEA